VPALTYCTAAAASTAVRPMRRRSFSVTTTDGGLLDELLVAALDRALALAEVHHVALAVGHHLDLDVAGALDVLLDVHVGTPKAAWASAWAAR